MLTGRAGIVCKAVGSLATSLYSIINSTSCVRNGFGLRLQEPENSMMFISISMKNQNLINIYAPHILTIKFEKLQKARQRS